MKGRYASALILTSATLAASAQLTITDSLGLAATATLLEGLNVSIVNLTVNCEGQAFGEFNGTSEIPISHGIVLSTGMVDDIAGANVNGGTSTALGSVGDVDLDMQVVPFSTYDACVLEFDCIPLGDTLLFNFSFGSEEYPEWVGQPFNDVFAIWLSGPGFPIPTNVAAIPGGTVVSINSVNANTNPAYYIDNTAGVLCALDGFTQNLTAHAVVVPGDTYHFKIAIADVSDGVFDSAVLLEAFSFRSVSGISTGLTETTVRSATATWNGDRLEIVSTNGVQQVEVIDASGRRLKHFTMTGERTTVSMPDIGVGCFLVRVTGPDGAQVLRTIK